MGGKSMKAQLEGTVKIKAVHDDDLKTLLEKLGILKDIEDGKIQCDFCNCTISNSNFGGIFRENGDIKPFCQKTECYLEVLKKKGNSQ